MSDQIKVGQLITGDAERDAIHVAIVPLVAAQYLQPGDPFKLANGTSDVALYAHKGEEAIGIVDPFLSHEVKDGDRFYGFLKPNSVTGMRHHWKHPVFDTLPEKSVDNHADSKEWLENFCEKWHFNYYALINAGLTGDYVVADGIDLHSANDLGEGEEALFWYHLEKITGQHFSPEHKQEMGWSCSC